MVKNPVKDLRDPPFITFKELQNLWTLYVKSRELDFLVFIKWIKEKKEMSLYKEVK